MTKFPFLLCMFLWLITDAQLNAQLNFDTIQSRAKRYAKMNYDSAEHYYILQDSLAKELGEINKALDACIFLSTYYNMNQRYPEGQQLIEEIWDLEMDTAYRVEIGNAYANIMGHSDQDFADSIYKAIIPFADEYHERLNNSSSLYANYGLFLVYRGKPYEGAIFFEKALVNPYTEYQKYLTLNSLCRVFTSVENWTRVEDYVNQSIEISERNGYKDRNGFTAVNYANLLIEQGEFQKARLELKKAHSHKPFVRHDEYYISLLSANSKYYERTNQWDSIGVLLTYDKFEPFSNNSEYLITKLKHLTAQKKYKEALQIAKYTKDVGIKNRLPYILLEAYRSSAELHEKLGNKIQAFDDLKFAKTLTDSLFYEKQSQEINYLEARYRRGEQDRMISLLDEKNQAQSKVLSQQRKILIGGSISLILISLLSFFMWRLFRIVKGQKEEIKKTLGQKDILLREIHHRVKNNLQLVNSLLTLQSRSITDETALEALQEGKSRVRSMALIHQDLYNKENITSISSKDYIKKLTRELFETYKLKSEKINLTTEVEDIDLDVDTLVPLGLIINELITNSLKYAFEGRESGTLQVNLKKEGERLILTISDNGIGSHEKIEKENSFGTTLVNALTKQLGGNIERKNDSGMHINMTFTDFKIT